ncbi:MAG: TIGR04282 family arsenosugar biosynthesis glycosyltransferase [Bacteroidetes bacterium]|nr:TIGR04282 family arsenosugar biosynthesis glycosyltransferase [Bacteroidota bacterium]HET6243146.1 TIGR04282 family arsenosugar biosynthesis glycosyltransferase [Bacteroidia bacterium]
MATDKLLMVFVKNPQRGKVKTRLATTMGDEKALEIYRVLLDHTLTISKRVNCDKAIFYSDYIDDGDMWGKAKFSQFVQEGNELGERMLNAFKQAFLKQYKSVVIIGSDCLDLNEHIITDAFDVLKKNEIVIGPAKDGGYYLLGMRTLYKELFMNKQWSTENVLLDTLLDITKLNVSMKLLPTLSDIDEEKDLKMYQNIFEI